MKHTINLHIKNWKMNLYIVVWTWSLSLTNAWWRIRFNVICIHSFLICFCIKNWGQLLFNSHEVWFSMTLLEENVFRKFSSSLLFFIFISDYNIHSCRVIVLNASIDLSQQQSYNVAIIMINDGSLNFYFSILITQSNWRFHFKTKLHTLNLIINILILLL